MSLASLEKHARRGTLDVEHLFKEMTYPDHRLADLLDRLCVELQWSRLGADRDGVHEVPFANWAIVIAAYCRAGSAGMVALARDPSMVDFVLGLMEEMPTQENLATVLLAFQRQVDAPESDIPLSFRVARAVDVMCSFQPAADILPHQRLMLQGFLTRLYGYATDDRQRAWALLALRGIGDESTAIFIARQRLAYPYQKMPAMIAGHIRKRLHAAT